MRGHNIKAANGEEADMLSRRARRMVSHKAGRAKAAKRTYNKRLRKWLSREPEHEKDLC